TSLQYAAKQLAANFSVMMAAQIWRRTAYWLRQEMVEIILERVEPIPVFRDHKSKIVDAIYSWLHKFIMHEGALDAQPCLAGKSEEEIRTLFFEHVKAKLNERKKGSRSRSHRAVDLFATDTHRNAWNEIWNEMFTRFARHILTVLIPFESRNAATGGDDASEVVDVEDISASKAKGRDFISCRRAEWLFAILKRLEELQKRAEKRFESEESVSGKQHQQQKRKRHPPVLKMHRLFPLTGNVPGHIQCTEQLLLHAYKAYLKEHGTERDKQQEVVLTDWMKLFGPPPEFWKLKQEEGGVSGETTCRVRLRNKFMTDGITLSLTETTVVLKKTRPKLKTKFVPISAKIRMPYVDKEMIEDLMHHHNVRMVLFADPGLGRMLTGKFFPIERIREAITRQQQAAAAAATQVGGSEYKQVGFRELFDAPDTRNLTKGDAKFSWRQQRKQATGIDFRITAKERAYMCKTKKHQKLRQRLQQEDTGRREEEG
ncbi:hypothetical protein V1523DRAFT_418668, partial [Lipomyces doorenjongii]